MTVVIQVELNVAGTCTAEAMGVVSFAIRNVNVYRFRMAMRASKKGLQGIGLRIDWRLDYSLGSQEMEMVREFRRSVG